MSKGMLRLSKDSLDLGLVVSDLAASVHFYGEVLRLPHFDDLTQLSGMSIHRFSAGSSLVKLVRLNSVPVARNPPGGGFAAIGLRYFTLFVPDVDRVVYRCLDAGIEVPQLPKETRPGHWNAKVADPDGNWIE